MATAQQLHFVVGVCYNVSAYRFLMAAHNLQARSLWLYKEASRRAVLMQQANRLTGDEYLQAVGCMCNQGASIFDGLGLI